MEERTQVELLQYQLVAERRSGTNSMMWQVPVLSLTAQSFLFTIAFSPGVGAGFRILAALLALAASLASLQLMSKHRLLERMDSIGLEEFEKSHTAQGFEAIHARPVLPDQASLPERLIGYSSYRVWIGLLGVFAAASLMSIGLISLGVFLSLAQKVLGYD